MKQLRYILLALALTSSVFAQKGPVTKSTAGSTKNDLVEDFNVGSGRTVTVKSGGEIDASAGTLTLADDQVTWAKVDKSGSDFDDIETTPTTLAGYGIADAQGLDTDLTSIAALTTTAYGRALLEAVDAATLFGAIKQDATTSEAGVMEFATDTEAADPTNTTHALNPANLHSQIAPALSNRTPIALPISDGATTNRAIVQTGTARTNLAGAPAATWRGLVYVPASNPTAEYTLFGGASSSASSPVGQTNTQHAYIGTSGQLNIRANKASVDVADRRIFGYSGFRAAYSGQWIILEVYFVSGTTDPVVRVNDVDISASFSISAGGSPPEWLEAASLWTNFLTGHNAPAGPAPLGGWINAALADADRTYWRTTGQPPAWVVKGGSNVSLVTNGTFESDVSGWSSTASASTSHETESPITGAGSMSVDFASNGHYVYQDIPTIIGQKYRVKARTKDVSLAGSKNIGLSGTSTGGGITDFNDTEVQSGTALEFNIEWTATVSTTRLRITSQGGVSGEMLVDDVSVTALGALSIPIQGPDGIVLDGTRSDAPVIGTMPGMSWNRPSPIGTRYGVTKTYAHDAISSTAATTTFCTIPTGWAVVRIDADPVAAFDASTVLDFGISGTPEKYGSDMAIDVTTPVYEASATLAPVESNTTLYVQKNQATSGGNGPIKITTTLERIF